MLYAHHFEGQALLQYGKKLSQQLPPYQSFNSYDWEYSDIFMTLLFGQLLEAAVRYKAVLSSNCCLIEPFRKIVS